MELSSISPVSVHTAGMRESAPTASVMDRGRAPMAREPDKAADAAKQFEAILLRQILTESMGSLVNGGGAGSVYGYMVTDTLADSMSKAGGLGMSEILEAQFKQ